MLDRRRKRWCTPALRKNSCRAESGQTATCVRSRWSYLITLASGLVRTSRTRSHGLPTRHHRDRRIESAILRRPEGVKRLNPFPAPGDPSARPSGPSTPSAAMEGHPGAARGRPMAPRDRGRQRNKAITRGKQLFSQIRSPCSQICHADRHQLGALSAGEVCPQFARCGCRRGSELHSYSRWAYASGS